MPKKFSHAVSAFLEQSRPLPSNITAKIHFNEKSDIRKYAQPFRNAIVNAILNESETPGSVTIQPVQTGLLIFVKNGALSEERVVNILERDVLKPQNRSLHKMKDRIYTPIENAL